MPKTFIGQTTIQVLTQDSKRNFSISDQITISNYDGFSEGLIKYLDRIKIKPSNIHILQYQTNIKKAKTTNEKPTMHLNIVFFVELEYQMSKFEGHRNTGDDYNKFVEMVNKKEFHEITSLEYEGEPVKFVAKK